jgi:hypothetical protein
VSYARRTVTAALVGLLLLACGQEDDAEEGVVRGRGMQPAALPADARARVYEAALGAAFDLGPSLTLLLDPRLLPRTAGIAGGEAVDADLVAALRRRGVVQGTCEPPTDGTRQTPRCEARAAGYVVRFSDVFQSSPDTVQVYLMAEQYDTPTSGAHESLRFEKAFEVVGRGGTWRVAREARVPESARPTSR